MADSVIELFDVTFRHKIPKPKLTNPWFKTKGSGIFSMNLSLKKGQILGLVGPNGAGKTTLLRVLAGIIPIDAGMVKLNGVDLSTLDNSIDNQLRANVGHMPEQVRWAGRVTVMQTLEKFAAMRPQSISSDKLLSLVGLKAKSDSPLDELSQGMRQRLSLAVALMGSPKILLLDEPFNGLDPVAAKSVEKMIKQLAKKGVTVIVSSHQVSGLVDLVDRLLLIHRGQLVADGTIDEIEANLGLNNRIEVSGTGQYPDLKKILSSSVIIDKIVRENYWQCTIQNPADDAMMEIVNAGCQITEWKRKPPDIVELLCHATGLEIEEIGMEIQSSTMMPLRLATEEE